MPNPSRVVAACRIGLTAATVALSACGGGAADEPTEAPLALTDVAADTSARPTETALRVAPTPLAQLGRQIFTDTNLSEPRGTACAACHQPDRGFAGNHGSRVGVALGSTPNALGLRNSLSNAYQGLVPRFGFRTENGTTEAIGGHFWDGRGATPQAQAVQPFLNPLEMNNPSEAAVVAKVATSSYAAAFRRAFGANIFADPHAAMQRMGEALAAFELETLQPYSSKYDAMVRGQAAFTPAESRGMALFRDANRANCAGCHLMNPGTGNPIDSPFSEFTYYALGVPRNGAIPRNADPGFFDLGLCGPERTDVAMPVGQSIEDFCSKFRMPSLRNVAKRSNFMHNGFFNDLNEVVRFYSTRNSNPRRWYGPSGMPNDIPARHWANLETSKAPLNRPASAGPLLTEAEVADLVAFLHTLSDGFTAATAPTP